MSKSILNSTDDGNKCSICQDTESFKDVLALPCAHKFHELCINEWLKKKSVCPICRLRVGNEGNAPDEGLGEGYEFDSLSDETTGSLAHDEMLGTYVYSIDQNDLIVEHFREDSDSSDEGLVVQLLSDVYVDDTETDSDADDNESYDEPGNITFDADNETSESEDEPNLSRAEYDTGESDEETSIFSDPEHETSESDSEPNNFLCAEHDASESDDESANSESSNEPGLVILEDSFDANETFDEPESINIHLEIVESESESEESNESDSTESETTESKIYESETYQSDTTDNESETTESYSESDYDSSSD